MQSEALSVGSAVHVRLPRRNVRDHPAVRKTLDACFKADSTRKTLDVRWHAVSVANMTLPKLSWNKNHGEPPVFYGINGDYETGVSRTHVETSLGYVSRGDFHPALVTEVKETSFVVEFVFKKACDAEFYGTTAVSLRDKGTSWRLPNEDDDVEEFVDDHPEVAPLDQNEGSAGVNSSGSLKRPRGRAPLGKKWDESRGAWVPDAVEAPRKTAAPEFDVPDVPSVGATAVDDLFEMTHRPPNAAKEPLASCGTIGDLAEMWNEKLHALSRAALRRETKETASRLALQMLDHVETHGEVPNADAQSDMRDQTTRDVRNEYERNGIPTIRGLEQLEGVANEVLKTLSSHLANLEAEILPPKSAVPQTTEHRSGPEDVLEDVAHTPLPAGFVRVQSFPIPCPCEHFERAVVAHAYHHTTFETAPALMKTSYPFPLHMSTPDPGQKARYDAELRNPTATSVVRRVTAAPGSSSDAELALTERGWRVLGDFLVDEMAHTTQKKLRALIAMGGGCVSEATLHRLLELLGVSNATAQRALYPSVCRSDAQLSDPSNPKILLRPKETPTLVEWTRVDGLHVRALRCKLFGTPFDDSLQVGPGINLLLPLVTTPTHEETPNTSRSAQETTDVESETTEEASTSTDAVTHAQGDDRSLKEIVSSALRVLSVFVGSMADESSLRQRVATRLARRLQDNPDPVTSSEMSDLRSSVRVESVQDVRMGRVGVEHVAVLASAVAQIEGLNERIASAENALATHGTT